MDNPVQEHEVEKLANKWFFNFLQGPVSALGPKRVFEGFTPVAVYTSVMMLNKNWWYLSTRFPLPFSNTSASVARTSLSTEVSEASGEKVLIITSAVGGEEVVLYDIPPEALRLEPPSPEEITNHITRCLKKGTFTPNLMNHVPPHYINEEIKILLRNQPS